MKLALLFFLVLPFAKLQADELKVTLLGTGTPRPSIERFGAATLVEYMNEKYLFDVGRGATIRLNQLGLSPSDINHLFITHLHSDHVTGYSDFWLTGWIWQRETKLNVYGPDGTSNFVNYICQAHSKDIEYRHAHTNIATHNLPAISKDIEEGIVYDNNDVKITAFRVEHGSVEDAFGYRFETSNHSIVFSGDTTFSKNLIRYGKKADLLIHELAVIRPNLLYANERLKKISEYHTSIDDLASVINAISPKQTVLNHLLLIGEEESSIKDKLEILFGKKVILGSDLMLITFENEKVCVKGDCQITDE